MTAFKHFIQQYEGHLAAFFLPSLIMTITYASQGIYWGSETSPLLGDGFHQYVIFDVALRNILHGSDSLFYTFTSGLGLNFYALSSYYLGSFFSPLVYFFDLNSMPDAVYLFTILKFGCMGLTSFISLKGIFKKIPVNLLLVLSTSYALMSFATSQIEIKTWLDVFILAPLILLGLHRLITEQKRILYFTSLSILFIQNYYFGYMMALFLVFWYLVQLSWNFKNRIKSFLDFTLVSILAGLTSLIMILPTFLDLKTHGENLTEVSRWLSEDSWYLDFFAKNFLGAFDTTKYGSIPMIYVGIIPLLLAITFFTLKTIKFHVKLAYLVLVLIFIASFYLEPLDLFWQGMHAPNMFLHRYSWLFSLLIIQLAGESLNRLTEIKSKNFFLSILFLSAGYLLTFIFRKEYDFLKLVNFILTSEFLAAYALIFGTYFRKKLPLKIFTLAALLFTTFETSLNSFYQVDGIAQEWIFASRKSYAKNLEEVDNLVKMAKNENQDFFRLERLESQTGNDSMKYNYNGISQFSSVRNTSTSSTLDKLGFKSSGTNLNLRYQNNSIIMDSLVGISYNISSKNPQKYGFKEVDTTDNLVLYQNQNALPLGILSAQPYQDQAFDNLTLDNQTKFLNQLAGSKFQYYYRLESTALYTAKEMGKRVIVEEDEKGTTSLAYQVKVPAQSQVYLTLPQLTFANEDHEDIDISVNDQSFHYTNHNVFAFFNLGYFSEEELVTVRLTFPENKSVSFNQPEFYRLNTQNFQEAIDKIKGQQTQTSTKGNQVVSHYKAKQDTSLLFTLPYDKGWTASLNGQKLAIKATQKGFMRVEVPKGEGTVYLTFLPQGLKEGSLSSLAGISLFTLYNWLRNRQKKELEITSSFYYFYKIKNLDFSRFPAVYSLRQ